jgi:gamma-butyrobetaine dioxygenase
MSDSAETTQLTVPDFDTYLVEHTLRDAVAVEGGLELCWSDGMSNRVPNIWLREYSPDLGTFHNVTREQRIALTDIPQDLAASEVTIGSDGFLQLTWSPEGLCSRYHPGWLRTAVSESNNPLHGLPARKLWPCPVADPVFLDGAALYEGDNNALLNWLETLHRDGVGLLTGLPLERAVIPAIAERIGAVRPSNFGSVFEVESLPSANSNAYTAIALGVHSDLATREYMPGLQFLFCLENSVTGGESLLVDGFAVARQLREESPEFFEVLSTLPVPFGTKDREYDHRFCAPILEHNTAGELTTVRHTYWLRTPMQGEFDTLKHFYAAYHRFQELTNDPANQLRFRLEPGQLMAMDNRRILHGRAAFDPQSGKRLLRGCYGEREELESRLRILYRRQREQQQLEC